MTEPLPAFRYHPDPVATGMVVRQDITCEVCGRERDHAYIGPYYDPGDHGVNEDPLCPWCIADGSAAREWDASFVVTSYLSPAAQKQMSPAALDELAHRTPAYLCLEQDRWLDHHGEAGAYLGAVDADGYLQLPAPAQVAVRTAVGDYPTRELRDSDLVLTLRRGGEGPTAYLFQCLHCERYDAFVAYG